MPLAPHMTGEEFYKERDSRTSLKASEGVLKSAKVAVTIDRDEVQRAEGQAAFILSVNLISRWCRNVFVCAPRAPVHPLLKLPRASSIDEVALKIARRADPFGQFTIVDRVPADHPGVHVGRNPESGEFPVLGRGWLAIAGEEVKEIGDEDESSNLLGSWFAACIGVSYAFRRVLRHTKDLPKRCKLSLWNLRGGKGAQQGPQIESPALGRVLIVGAGAVGSAVCYFLPYLNPELDSITLLDEDPVEISNLNRTPLFIAEDVDLPKVNVAANYLRAFRFQAFPVPAWFDKATKSGQVSVNAHDLVLPLANERNIINSLQEQVPPMAVYGTTGTNWDIFLGRHIPLKEDCLACRFPAPVTVPRFACSIGFLAEPADRTNGNGETGALPFASSAAALITCAELAKLAFPGYPSNSNYASLGFLGPLDDFLTLPFNATPGCTRCPRKGVWLRLNGGSRFARLSV